MKIIALGNEFIKEDSLAKEICLELQKEMSCEFVFIKDSFQLMEELNSEDKMVIVDVVKDLKEVRKIKIEDIIFVV